MNRLTTILSTAALALAPVSLAAADNTAPTVRYHSASSGSSVLVEGTSNIHDWSGTSETIIGHVDVPGRWVERDGELQLEHALADGDARVAIAVKIPVKELEGNRRGLASNMHDALEADDHPYVTFTLNDLAGATSAGNGAQWTASGALTVAGSSRDVELALRLSARPNGNVRVELTKDLLMTDFGIDPPRAMMGMARAADEVQVNITWELTRAAGQPTVPTDASSAAHRAAMSELLGAYAKARAALAAEDLGAVQTALGELNDHVAALDELDDAALAPEAAEAWSAVAQRLGRAASAAGRASTLNAARAGMVGLSQMLADAVAIVGHDEPAVLAYRDAQGQGLAAAMWLQLGGEPAMVGSPYASEAISALPQVDAFYAGRAAVTGE